MLSYRYIIRLLTSGRLNSKPTTISSFNSEDAAVVQ